MTWTADSIGVSFSIVGLEARQIEMRAFRINYSRVSCPVTLYRSVCRSGAFLFLAPFLILLSATWCRGQTIEPFESPFANMTFEELNAGPLSPPDGSRAVHKNWMYFDVKIVGEMFCWDSQGNPVSAGGGYFVNSDGTTQMTLEAHGSAQALRYRQRLENIDHDYWVYYVPLVVKKFELKKMVCNPVPLVRDERRPQTITWRGWEANDPLVLRIAFPVAGEEYGPPFSELVLAGRLGTCNWSEGTVAASRYPPLMLNSTSPPKVIDAKSMNANPGGTQFRLRGYTLFEQGGFVGNGNVQLFCGGALLNWVDLDILVINDHRHPRQILAPSPPFIPRARQKLILVHPTSRPSRPGIQKTRSSTVRLAATVTARELPC